MRNSKPYIKSALLLAVVLSVSAAAPGGPKASDRKAEPAGRAEEEACITAADETVVGIVTFTQTEPFVIVENTETGKKRLFAKEDYKKLKGKEKFRILETSEVDTIEYRYKPLKERVKFVSEEFELIELKGKKAIMKKDYIEPPPAPAREEPVEEPVEAIEEEELLLPLDEPAKEPTAKNLVAAFFYKIESKKISETEWEVSLPTVMDAAANFRRVLGIVTEKIAAIADIKKSQRLYFDTAVGKGVLAGDGLLVESLSSSLKDKSGLKDDDLIKAVNGKGLSTIQDVAAVFSGFTGAPQTFTVKLMRGDKELTHTYYLK